MIASTHMAAYFLLLTTHVLLLTRWDVLLDAYLAEFSAQVLRSTCGVLQHSVATPLPRPHCALTAPAPHPHCTLTSPYRALHRTLTALLLHPLRTTCCSCCACPPTSATRRS